MADGPQVSPVLVLGSASPARLTLLRSAGITPVVVASTVDEDALIAAAGPEGTEPHALTQLLARAKALDVAEQVRSGSVATLRPQTGNDGDAGREFAGQGRAGQDRAGRPVLVIAADSMLAFEGQILGKALSAQEVRDRWAVMSGRWGVLVTGHTLVELATGRAVEATAATTVRFGRPDPVELEAYIESGEPLAVAGSCTIDGLGGAFIDGLDGDHSNVIGLGLPTLRALLAEVGVRWTDLWDRPWGGHRANEEHVRRMTGENARDAGPRGGRRVRR